MKKTYHISKRNVMFVIKTDIKWRDRLKKEVKDLEKAIKSDIYQIVDTRGVEWQIQKCKDKIKQINKEIRAIRSLLSKGKCVYNGDTYILK